MSTQPVRVVEAAEPMSHREVLEALSGLLLSLFVAMLSSTIVATALPRIVADLDGSESGYAWVIVASLLTTSTTTPIWGKLADLFSKKLLVQLALLVFVAGSVLAGLAPNMGFLIGARAVQGVGVGGLVALVQVVIATIVSPRERGRYSGYLGAVFAVATVSGPLIGGLIVDTPGLGWRWCFYVGIPVAAVALVVLQKTLHVPTIKREVSIDYAGAALLISGVSLLLIWVSLAGHQFDWASPATAWMVTASVLLLAGALYAEARAKEPIIPLRLFRDRTTSLATFSSVMVGVAMFAGTVFLSQYFQISRGMSPTAAGLMSLAMVGGLLFSSITTGRLISRYGRWKPYIVAGAALTVVGSALLGTIDDRTSITLVGFYMALLGTGIGGMNQNLVVAVQNNTPMRDMGAASSLVSFFRTLGGSIGVSGLGAALGSSVAGNVAAGLSGLGVELDGSGETTRSIPDMATLPGPVREVFEHAYGVGTAHIFLLTTPFVVLALVAVLCIREVPLRTTIEHPDDGTSR
ncbi:MAG TPA: MFS transporter [Nocardioidaceae bacterium]|nr:MFS transporter [Nocardioidaceae bacterium]